MSIERNRKGHLIVDGKSEPPNRPDNLTKLGQDDNEHQVMQRFFEPSFEESLKEVLQEISVLHNLGLLRPFKEGEPIGAYHKPPKPKRLTDKQVIEYRNKRRQWAREEMLTLRARNDITMREILGR